MMLPFEDRYSRQRRLVDVGPEGQRRLEAARVSLGDHAGASVERTYLLRAGVSQVQLDSLAPSLEFPWLEQFQFTAPLTIARGAWSALSRIVSALGLPRR
jgi:hypothetical protein